VLDASWDAWGESSVVLDASWVVLDAPPVVLDASWVVLDASWDAWGESSVVLDAPSVVLDARQALLGARQALLWAPVACEAVPVASGAGAVLAVTGELPAPGDASGWPGKRVSGSAGPELGRRPGQVDRSFLGAGAIRCRTVAALEAALPAARQQASPAPGESWEQDACTSVPVVPQARDACTSVPVVPQARDACRAPNGSLERDELPVVWPGEQVAQGAWVMLAVARWGSMRSGAARFGCGSRCRHVLTSGRGCS